MKELNPESLFDPFKATDEEIYKEHGVEHLFDDNLILLGTVIKAVEHYHILEKMYENRYQESFSPIREKIKLKYFIGLIVYLERIDLSKGDKLLQLKEEFGEEVIKYSLNEMLTFFEMKEYYEECALVLKINQIFFPQ